MILDHRGNEIFPSQLTSTKKPHWAHGKLQWGGNPFGSLGMDWCPRCQSECDTNTEANHRGGIYTYKRWCLRCGRVVKFGAYQAELISSEGLRPAVFTWITAPEKDRR